MTYRVTLITASGRERDTTVEAKTDQEASNVALRKIKESSTDTSWRVLRVQ